MHSVRKNTLNNPSQLKCMDKWSFNLKDMIHN